MKKLLPAALIAAVALTVTPAFADAYLWDPSAGGAAGSNGAGSWDTSSLVWYDTTSATGAQAYGNNLTDTVTFGTATAGDGATVSTGTVNAAGITFATTTTAGYTLSGGTITLGASATVTNNNAAFSSTIGSKLTGSGALLFTGTGNTILSGSTTATDYTGAITVGTTAIASKLEISGTTNAASMSVGNATLGSTLKVDAGAGLTTTGALTLTKSTGTINGSVSSGSLNIFTSSTLNIAATGSVTTGAVTSSNTSGSTITVASGGSFTGTSVGGSQSLNITANGAVSLGDVSNNAITTWSGAGTIGLTSFAGSNNNLLTYSGTGTVTDSGNFTLGTSANSNHGGFFTQSNGTVNLNSSTTNSLLVGNGAYAGTLTVSGGIMNALNSALVVASGAGAGSFTVSGGTANMRGITIGTAGTGTGSLTVSGGFLNVGSGGIVAGAGTGTRTITLGASTLGSLAASGGWSSSLAMVLNNSVTGTTFDTTNGDIALGGVLSSTGKLNKSGAGTLTLTGANNYAGGVTFNAGTVLVNNDSALGTGTIDFKGGTVASADASARTFTNAVSLSTTGVFGSAGTGNLRFTGDNALGNAAGGAKTITVNNAVTEFSGVLASTDTTGSLTKNGAGTLILSGANTYLKSTVVATGTLVANNTSALGAGHVSLAGGTLQVGNGSNQLMLGNAANITTTAATASVVKFFANLGADTGSGALANITLVGGGKYDFSLGTLTLDLGNLFDAQGTYHLIAGGIGNVDAASYTFTGANTGSFFFTFANGDLAVTAVPEPSTYGFLGAGALAAVAFVRRRKAA